MRLSYFNIYISVIKFLSFCLAILLSSCSDIISLSNQNKKIIQNKKAYTFSSKSYPNSELNYLIYFPIDYKKKYVFPLVVFLHGAGERGSNLKLVEKHGIPKLINSGKKFPFITIAPQCPKSGYWSDSTYVDILIQLIEKIKMEYKVDHNRVYATGLSMGGFGTLAVAKERSDLFAAIVPICGGLDTKNIERLYNMPIWLFHGSDDRVIPLERSQIIYDLLKPNNPTIKLTVYEGVGHNSWDRAYNNKNIYQWMLSFKK